MNIPALMIAFNRLSYTKKALQALIESDCSIILVVNNGSTDGTEKYLNSINNFRVSVYHNKGKNSIAAAMNLFLNLSDEYKYCIKVDNDTIIPKDFCKRMLPYMEYADIIQAKHHIIPATNPGGWEGFTKNIKTIENGLLYYHYVGGSGIMFKRSVVDTIPETGEPLGGWRHFQRLHPELRKAFVPDVEIKLLDEHGYEDYPEYYKLTGRC